MALLTFRSVEHRTTDGKIHFWIERGFHEPAEVRGKDVVIPGAGGRYARGRAKDVRTIELLGKVTGAGATEAIAQADYLALMDSLLAVWDRSLAPGDLRIYAPLMGLASGYAHLNARVTNVVPGSMIGGFQRLYSVELLCIDSPPEWVRVP
jgi:hypothetical protein